jgi:serine/threonine protein kinase
MEIVQGGRLGNRFKIVECLGRGQLGPVFVAADGSQMDRLVALKVFEEKFLKREELRERLSSSIDEEQKLDHDNLLRALEVVDDGEFRAFAMEYGDGGNLSTRVQAEGRLDLGTLVDVLKQIVNGIGTLHESGKLHYEIKPANILFLKDGVVKLADAELASIRHDNGEQQFKIGTAQYKAPEYLRSGFYDEQCDIYSWGVVAHELYHGALPMDDAQRDTLATVAMIDAPPDYSCPELESIISKACARERSQRYQSAFEIWRDLDKLERMLTPPRFFGPGVVTTLLCGYMLTGLYLMAQFLAGVNPLALLQQ